MISLDTRILTQDGGYGAIEGFTAPFALWTGVGVDTTGLTLSEPHKTLLIKLVNGLEFKCSPEQWVKTRNKNPDGDRCFQAKDLKRAIMVHLSDKSFEFDYLDLSCYNYLSRLSSEEVGLLVGLCQNLGFESPDIPRARLEVILEIDKLFKKLLLPHQKTKYFKRAERFRYDITDAQYKEEIKKFSVNETLPRDFWRSKAFLRGYLRGMFTFGYIGNEMFVIRASKESQILKDIQQALLLFGINSTYSKGLKAGQLIVFKNNCYRFANSIGIIPLEGLFQGVDFRRFLEYKDRTTTDMQYSKVRSIEEVGEQRLVELDASQFMANGVILQNYE